MPASPLKVLEVAFEIFAAVASPASQLNQAISRKIAHILHGHLLLGMNQNVKMTRAGSLEIFRLARAAKYSQRYLKF